MKRKTVVLLITLGIVGGGALAAILAMLGVPFYCPFHVLTGLNCPGCGNTRATLALLRLDFQSVFYYNLMYPVEIFYILWVYIQSCRNYIEEGKFYYGKKFIVLDIIILVLIMVWFVVRNLTLLF